MAVTRYSAEVDLDNLNSSHSLAILSIAPGSRVLDLGAADGSVARRLKERGCAVWAVEFDPVSADVARQVCDRVITGDLETDDVWRALEGETFDAILALDILEHLRRPEPVLARAARHLAEAGFVVVSLPNITHGAIRLSLLQGHFRYQETGPLDNTHLRFFDRAGAEQLMRSAGLVIRQRLRVSRALHETEVPVVTDGVVPELLETITRDPDATTYQFVFVAGPNGRPERPIAGAGAMLAERLLGDLESLKVRFVEVEEYARNLAADRERLLDARHTQAEDLRIALEQEREQHAAELTTLRAAAASLADEREERDRELAHEREERHRELEHERDELRRELEHRMREAHQRQLELKHTKLEIAVKEGFIHELRQDLQTTETRVSELESRTGRIAAERDRLAVELAALRRYANSAGFRLTESVIAGLKRIPFVFAPARWLVRTLAGASKRRD